LSPSSVDVFAPKYVYVVNRRCNIQEIPGDLPVQDSSHRYVSIKFHLDPGFINYTIHDLKTNSKYYTTTNGWVTIYLKAGEGTLLKIEPTVQAGGNLVENESIDYQVNVKSDLKLASGKTLSITNGADMKFLNSSKLDVSSANLNIFTINSGPVKLDFISRNWTAGNGIVAGGANVLINNAIISNGSAGISAWNPASLSISNTTIENCWFGVAVQSRPIGSIYLDNVKVIDCDSRGVTLDNANREIKNSRISGSGTGLRIAEGLVFAGDYESSQTYALDTLSNNDVGLYSYASMVDFGYYKAFLEHGNHTRKGTIAKGLLQVQNAIYEENPIVFLDSVASEYAKKLPAEQALYKKAVYQMMVQGDRKGAKISRLKLETDFPESHLLTDLNLLLSDTMTARNSTINQGLGKANSEGVVNVEYDYNLYNNYPNPFNPETVIKFSLKEKSNVILTVYNIAGQRVAELVSGEMEKGVFEKRFNGTKLSSGVYIFRLSAQSLESTTHYSKTMKSLLLK
jgi:hypothetical protein